MYYPITGICYSTSIAARIFLIKMQMLESFSSSKVSYPNSDNSASSSKILFCWNGFADNSS